MERSRDGGYRGRYRDRHNNGSTNRDNHEDRSTRGHYRGRPSHGSDHNGHYSSRSPSNGGYNYRSSRSSFNSRPVSSRNGSSTYYRPHHNDDYPPSSHPPPPPPSSSSNRTSSGNSSSQSNYYDNHSPSSRFDRSSNHREIYPSLLGEQPILSNGPLPPTSLYYAPSSQSISLPRDRGLPPLQYLESERNRYIPSSSSSSSYRRESPPPPVSSYRNERSMDYGSRNINNDIYMRGEYRPPTPPSLAPLSIRGDPYGDIYRANDYGPRSERYDIPSNRTNSSTRDYPMASIPSSGYRNDLYRNSSNVSMPSSSLYIPREQYVQDINYRPISQSRDYEMPSSSSRTNYSSSSIDSPENFTRNSRDRNPNDYHSSSRDRPNLKRSGSRYNDNGPIPSKRPMRR